MQETQVAGRVQIAGTIEYRDKDGNLIKSVPFSGGAQMQSDEPKQNEGEDNGNMGE
jgi:hypothetical protein